MYVLFINGLMEKNFLKELWESREDDLHDPWGKTVSPDEGMKCHDHPSQINNSRSFKMKACSCQMFRLTKLLPCLEKTACCVWKCDYSLRVINISILLAFLGYCCLCSVLLTVHFLGLDYEVNFEKFCTAESTKFLILQPCYTLRSRIQFSVYSEVPSLQFC